MAGAAISVLYVDDDADIRTIVTLALGLDPAITTRTVASGRAAIACIVEERWRPDVLVLDVMMPDMTGPETLEVLRRHRAIEATQVLFMTARARDADRDRYRALGAIDVIIKPFDPLRLVERIRVCAEQIHGAP